MEICPERLKNWVKSLIKVLTDQMGTEDNKEPFRKRAIFYFVVLIVVVNINTYVWQRAEQLQVTAPDKTIMSMIEKLKRQNVWR